MELDRRPLDEQARDIIWTMRSGHQCEDIRCGACVDFLTGALTKVRRETIVECARIADVAAKIAEEKKRAEGRHFMRNVQKTYASSIAGKIRKLLLTPKPLDQQEEEVNHDEPRDPRAGGSSGPGSGSGAAEATT